MITGLLTNKQTELSGDWGCTDVTAARLCPSFQRRARLVRQLACNRSYRRALWMV